MRPLTTITLVAVLLAAPSFAITLEGLVDHQVVQVGDDGNATVTLTGEAPDGALEVLLDDADESALVESWQPLGEASGGSYSAEVTLAAGGPYTIVVRAADGASASVDHVLAGDLWVMAGQSNMQGVGNLKDLPHPHPQVNLLRMNHEWVNAKDPLHILPESPDPVHSKFETEEQRAAAVRNSYDGTKGAGVGLPFAIEMVERTGRPVGLIATAHGGTSMDQWDPAKKATGGESLYGSMLMQVEAAGGNVRGVLWYQGESDANPTASLVFPEKFAGLIQAMRDDFGGPEMPFLFVQIGRFARFGEQPDWDVIQTAQLDAANTIDRCEVVATVDLELDDLIHIGTQGYRRLGDRLANLAETMLFDGTVTAGPRIASAERVASPYGQVVRVTFEGVNGGLHHEGRLSGFTVSEGPDGPIASQVYKQEIDPEDPNAVLVWVQKPPEQMHLWYGRGLNPYCNLTDSEDMALPVSGPIRVSSR